MKGASAAVNADAAVKTTAMTAVTVTIVMTAAAAAALKKPARNAENQLHAKFVQLKIQPYAETVRLKKPPRGGFFRVTSCHN